MQQVTQGVPSLIVTVNCGVYTSSQSTCIVILTGDAFLQPYAVLQSTALCIPAVRAVLLAGWQVIQYFTSVQWDTQVRSVFVLEVKAAVLAG